MRSNKEFKNLDEQVEIFKSKNLIVDNPEYAKQVLLRENYFFLTGYRHLLVDEKTKHCVLSIKNKTTQDKNKLLTTGLYREHCFIVCCTLTLVRVGGFNRLM